MANKSNLRFFAGERERAEMINSLATFRQPRNVERSMHSTRGYCIFFRSKRVLGRLANVEGAAVSSISPCVAGVKRDHLCERGPGVKQKCSSLLLHVSTGVGVENSRCRMFRAQSAHGRGSHGLERSTTNRTSCLRKWPPAPHGRIRGILGVSVALAAGTRGCTCDRSTLRTSTGHLDCGRARTRRSCTKC